MANGSESPQGELEQTVQRLQRDVTRHLKIEQSLSRARDRLDQELERHRAMQLYNSRALKAKTRGELADLSVDAIIEVFEFECAALYLNNPNSTMLELAGRFGNIQFPSVVGLDNFLDHSIAAPGSILMDGQDLRLREWKDTPLLQAMVCSFGDRDNHVRGLIMGGRTTHRSEVYPEMRPELLPSFSLLAQQIESVWTHHDLNSNLREALKQVEKYKSRLEAENIYLRTEVAEAHGFQGIIGSSTALNVVLYQVRQVAISNATVLILGESGTGKELIARAVHEASPREGRPLVKLNCAAIPSRLVESELFGHTRGAFTGATEQRTGRFELADGGTLFLDEVGELALDTQGKLLRVLQEGEFERVGDSRTIKVDVRVIAATNRNLEAEVAAGRFRQDLFYRLHVFPITCPALRERVEDIVPLAHHFVRNFSVKSGKQIESISKESIRRLRAYDWPGNIRELQNMIERAVILCHGSRLEIDGWSSRETKQGSLKQPSSTNEYCSGAPRSLRDMEIELIREALSVCRGVVGGAKGAARWLDMPPSTLRERITRYNIERYPKYRNE